MAGFRFIDEVTVLLVSRYGRWACGWDYSVHNGGPVDAWCCDADSVGEAQETAEHVVTCLLEWRDWLEDVAERFEQLAPHPDADAEDGHARRTPQLAHHVRELADGLAAS
jgi:hypothetical protein